jgi:hypothetical protein
MLVLNPDSTYSKLETLVKKEPNSLLSRNRKEAKAEHWWLTPVILATQEAEIRRIEV